MRTREKLRTYFIGFGIGLILSGLMLYTRWQWRQANPPQDQSAQSIQPQTPPQSQSQDQSQAQTRPARP